MADQSFNRLMFGPLQQPPAYQGGGPSDNTLGNNPVYPSTSNPDEFSNLLTTPGPQSGLGSLDPGAGRNRITQALLNISQPPPVSPWQQDKPAMPAMGGQAPPAAQVPGTTAIGNMPSVALNPMAMATGRPPMMAGLPTTQPSMPMPGRPNYGA